MPRFDFQCQSCEKIFEHLLPTGAEPPPCLHCGNTEVQKLLSPPPAIFKGSGFYKTDSRKGEPEKSSPTPSETKEAPQKPPESDKKADRAPKTP